MRTLLVFGEKTCECGCGQPTSPATHTCRKEGRVKGQPLRFIHGHNRRGVPHLPEAREKIGAAQKVRDRRGPRGPYGPSGPQPWRWKTTAGRQALHSFLGRHYSKAGTCEFCGGHGRTDYAFRYHPESYTRDRADYMELCPSCHLKHDYDIGVTRGWRKEATT